MYSKLSMHRVQAKGAPYFRCKALQLHNFHLDQNVTYLLQDFLLVVVSCEFLPSVYVTSL